MVRRKWKSKPTLSMRDAARSLIEKCGGVVAGFSFVMELTGIDGMKSLGDYPTSSLVCMPA